MRLRSPRLLILGGVLFALGAVVLLSWTVNGSTLLLVVGLGLLCVSIPTLILGGRWVGERPNPLEARREQRLWTSGPLGRHWLSRRKRLP